MLPVHILSISYGRKLFRPDDDERARLAYCSRSVAMHHVVVFSLRSDALKKEVVHDTFVLHPTNSRSRVGMLFDAVRIGFSILRTARSHERWCISAQDPLMAGLVGYVLRLLTHRPLLLQEHGDIFSGTYWRSENFRNRLMYPLAYLLLRSADRVRVVALRVHMHVRQLGVSAARIVTLPVYSDLAHFRDALRSTDLRALHPEASLIVLSVARFVPQKNLPLLIRAFARLRAIDARAQLVLVGKGEDEQRVRNEVARLSLQGAVTIMPWSDDIPALMRSADIYALSSQYEGWARVLVEAMAAGLPVVTTDVGCVGEVFKDGVHGTVVQVGDEAGFAKALIALSQDTEARMRIREQGPKDALTLFAPLPVYAEQWAKVHVW